MTFVIPVSLLLIAVAASVIVRRRQQQKRSRRRSRSFSINLINRDAGEGVGDRPD